MKTRLVLAFALVWCASAPAAFAQVAMDLEAGVVFPGYNTVRIPGNGGTALSLSSELKTESAGFVRGRIFYSLGPRHTLSVLVAPLAVKATGQVPKVVQFQDKTFAANTPIEAKWKFNSYRLTYRYDLAVSDAVEFGLGLTGKIRDAEVRLSGGGETSAKTNVGFVPLINFRFLWNAAPRFGFLLEGDALAAPQGRAEDVLAAVLYRPSEGFSVKAGYRILEGGADNDKVYNFSLFHYAALGVMVTL